MKAVMASTVGLEFTQFTELAGEGTAHERG